MTEAGWRIEIRATALKSLKRLPRNDRDRISQAIDLLPAGDVRKLRGVQATWRLRVGEWRVLFSIDRGRRVIDVLAVRPRGRAYG